MKCLSIAIVFLITYLNVSGQNSKDILYQFPDKADLRYLEIDSTSNTIKKLSRGDVNEKKTNQFAQKCAFNKQRLFLSGDIYISWNEMEDYLNQILQLILPDTLKNRTNIHVYPTRFTDLNAFVLPDGSIYFNIGLFEKATNEASVAIILGHEIGHYLMNDSFSDYIKKKKNNNVAMIPNRSKTFKHSLDYAKYSRQQEIISDSIGFLLAKQNHYDLLFGIDNFKRFQDIETERAQKKAPKRVKEIEYGKGRLKSSEIDKLLATYPEQTERIQKLNDQIVADTSGLQKEFIVNEAIFRKLKKNARYEILAIALKNNPKECVKRSFINYLFEPSNPDYLYYLVESLRRLTGINPKLKDNTFLTEDFLAKRFNKDEGILHDVSCLLIDSSKITDIKATELINNDSIEFETYGQAYDYFMNIAIKEDNREAFLSMALAEIDKAKRNQYIEKYLSNSGCWYKEYAEALKKDALYSYLNNDSKNVFIYYFPQYFYYSISDFRKKYNKHVGFIKEISSIPRTKKENVSVYFSDNLSALVPNELMSYYNLIEDCFYNRKNDTIKKFDVEKKKSYSQIDIGVDAFTLSPDNWYFAVEQNIKSVCLYNGTYNNDCSNYFYISCNLTDNESYYDNILQCQKKASTILFKEYLKKNIRIDKQGKRSFTSTSFY